MCLPLLWWWGRVNSHSAHRNRQYYTKHVKLEPLCTDTFLASLFALFSVVSGWHGSGVDVEESSTTRRTGQDVCLWTAAEQESQWFYLWKPHGTDDVRHVSEANPEQQIRIRLPQIINRINPGQHVTEGLRLYSRLWRRVRSDSGAAAGREWSEYHIIRIMDTVYVLSYGRHPKHSLCDT